MTANDVDPVMLETIDSGQRPDACKQLPTRTAWTIEQYRREYAGLIRRSDLPIGIDDRTRLALTILEFGERNREYAPATIRLYSAALRLAITDLDNAIGLDRFDLTQLHAALDEASPAPRDKKAPKRTSSKKRKNLPHAEFVELLKFLASQGETAHLLGHLLFFGVVFGVRPIEWKDARLDGNILNVKCAKRSNRRGIADVRPLELIDWSDEDRLRLEQFLSKYQKEGEKAGWQTLHARLAKSLERACAAIGIETVSLYTLRHQAIATAKRNMTIDAVAALVGQAVDVTATRYAKRRGGWKMAMLVRPAPELVALVRHGKTAHPKSTTGFSGPK
jgi:integrase